MKSNSAEKRTSEFMESLKETLNINGTLLTIFTVALILTTGITLTNNPAQWWIPVVAVGSLFLTVFLFMNARIVIKVLVASILSLLLSAAGFTVGGLLEPLTSGAFVWMFSILASFFLLLALSTLITSGHSRWGVLIAAQLFSFLGTYLLAIGGFPVIASALAGLGLAVLFFIGYSRLGGRTRFSRKAMPQDVQSESLLLNIQEAAQRSGFTTRVLHHKSYSAILLWRERAYLLFPMELESPFGVTGRRGDRLGYHGKNINQWLLHLALKRVPTWKARNADILPVILDVKNRNGKAAKVIGATIPDSKRQLAVGIYPGKLVTSQDEPALQAAFAGLDSALQDYAEALTEKERSALEGFATSDAEEKE